MESQDENVILSNKEKIKAHFQKNKNFYIGFGLGSLVVLALHQKPICIINTVSPVFNNDNSSLVNFGGHATKFVKRMSDGEIWGTVTEAAEAAGCGIAKMSRHLNGHSPHVYNEIYKIVGVGTTR